MRRLALSFAALALLTLAACDGPLGKGPGVIPPADPQGTGVDGLLVGHRLMAAGEADLALKAYLRAASEQGMNVDTLSALGSANLALGRLGQAEQLLRRAVEADPRFVPAQNNLGVVLMERGRYAEARLVFQQAFALDSGQSDSIRENLLRALAALENPGYDDSEMPELQLIRRGTGEYETLGGL